MSIFRRKAHTMERIPYLETISRNLEIFGLMCETLKIIMLRSVERAFELKREVHTLWQIF